MKERWVVTAKRADFKGIASSYGIDQVIARIMRNRDLITKEEMDRYLYETVEELPSPWLLKDMDKAVEILQEKIIKKKKIRIIGDYDIDGVSATYILVTGLKRLGAEVDTYIPDRILDGYGIHNHLIEKAAEDQVDTIVTCDNGIAARKEVAYAKEKGMTVVITDHHEVPYEDTAEGRVEILPPADAVVNPKQKECSYPEHNICGAVVAAKLIIALFEKNSLPSDTWKEYLEIMAMATVGDVMDLRGENRTIVKEGLRRFSVTSNVGLKALIHVCDLNDKDITSTHIGFIIGPHINASGRIDHAEKSLQLLMENDAERAAILAEELHEMNLQRQMMTEQGKEDAIRQVEGTEEKNDPVLVVYLPELHESIAGIVAGRLRELYYKPSFVLTRGKDGAKGSGRSIEEYSMFEEMTKCKDVFLQYGGHPMAAGLSLTEENVPVFRKRINEVCTLTEEQLMQKIRIDVPMPLSYVTPQLIEQLSILEPFGKGNEKPVFAAKNLRVIKKIIFGKTGSFLRLTLQDEAFHQFEGICFRTTPEMFRLLEEKNVISVIYYPQMNHYNGRDRIQFVINHIS